MRPVRTLSRVGIDRRQLDDVAFLLALGAIGAATLAFVVKANGAAFVMCAICVAGIVAGRLAGISGLALLGVAIGLVGILWVAWVEPLATSRRTSAFAHTSGGFLVGAAIAVTLRRRLSWPAWGVAAIAAVAALTVGWEIAEYVADRLLDTALVPDRRDSAEDIFFGCFGGAAAITLVGLLVYSARARANGPES